MICTGCNASLPDGSAFCHLCGTKLQAAPAAAGAPPPRSAPPTPQRVTARTYTSTPSGRYTGASLVAGTLWVIGWIIAIGAIILGAVLASDYDPAFGEENAGAIRFGIFVGTSLAGWIYAVAILWMAYLLRLLADIERNTAGGRN